MKNKEHIEARIAYLKEVLHDVEEGLKLQNILTESGQINKERPFDEETFDILEVTEISNQIRALEWAIGVAGIEKIESA
jgi:hypothetical protein